MSQIEGLLDITSHLSGLENLDYGYILSSDFALSTLATMTNLKKIQVSVTKFQGNLVCDILEALGGGALEEIILQGDMIDLRKVHLVGWSKNVKVSLHW